MTQNSANIDSLRRQIFVACRDLGLDDAARHDVQHAACGKTSMRDMKSADFNAVLSHLKARGFKPGRSGTYKSANRADLRLIHVLWGLLGKSGKLKDPSRKGLNRFIRKRFEGVWGSVPIDVDALRDVNKITDIITALKNWCDREGVAREK